MDTLLTSKKNPWVSAIIICLTQPSEIEHLENYLRDCWQLKGNDKDEDHEDYIYQAGLVK